MRAWKWAGIAVLAMVVVWASSGCGGKKDPPACPVCPDGGPVVVDAGPAEYDGYAFRLVEKDGKVAFVATSSKGRVVVIPVDPRTRMFSTMDGKTEIGTADDLLLFQASSGGCPCRLPACWPYCRVADPQLSLSTLEFWGVPDMPAWKLPELETPGEVTPQPAPAPAPAPAP
jgi:hypothetical protein